MLEIVEQQERLQVVEVGELANAHRLRDRRCDERGILHGRKWNEEDAVTEVLDRLGRNLQSEPRLAAPTCARDRYQTPATGDQATQLCKLALPPDELGRDDREIRAIQALQRQKVTVAELVDSLRRRQVLEPMLAEIA